MTNSGTGDSEGQFLALAIANFVPDHSHLHSSCSVLAGSSTAASSSCSCPCSALPIYVGDQLRVICSHGQWCYGLKVGGGAKVTGQQRGIFPRSHVRPIRKKRQKTTGGNTNSSSGGRGSDEAMELVAEITDTAKAWWRSTKALYGAVNSTKTSCDEHIGRIRELMALRRRLRSGTVPTEELRELRLAIARLLDAGNAALHLPMHIRDHAGRAILTDELSIIASYKLHEEANARIVSQQSPHTVSPAAGDTVLVDKLLTQAAGQTTADGRSILLTLEHPQQQISSGAVELVLGLGRKAKGSTRPISEPLTIFLGGKMAKCRSSSRALFVGLSENDVGDEHNGLTLWVTAIRVGPLPGTGTLGKSGTGEDVRQFYAYGQLDISELCGDMAEKEQREFTLTMHKRPEAALPAICRQLPAGSSAAVPYLAAANSGPGGGCAGDKICLKASVQQLSRTTSPVCKDVQKLRMLKGCDCADGAEDEGRNEVFIWLRSADLHGVGKSEKTVEASISVVDEEGVFQPEAIEVVSPEGVRHQSSFRCRVWFSEDRPKLNELIKIRLPKGEVRNLHLQILFYNKLSGIDKKLSIPAAGPFALAFLRLINNFVLCADDEDELVVYKVEKRLPTSTSSSPSSKSMSNDSDGTRPISVSYLALWATRKEIRPRALSIGGGTMTRHESLCQLGISNGGGPYTLQNDKNNGVQFVSFVNSTLHTTNATLLQIMRWNDNEQLLSQRMHELCLALSDDQQRHNDWSRELCKFLPTVLDALFQIGAAIPLLQRGVFDTLAYICRFCEQSSQFKMDLGQYIQRMHFPKAHTFLLHHIIWYIENESEGSGGTLCHSLSSTCHDKLLAVLSSLSPLIQLALSSKRCAEMIENSTEELPQVECSSKQLFKQHMEKLLAAIRRLLTSPGRRVTCQNMALRHLESSIVRPMASDGIYEPIELAKYALEVMDSLSEGVQMNQKLHFIGQLIESELFLNVECRRLLLCRCLDELVSRMPPHARGEEACGGQFIHRTRSRSNCSVGTFAASGDDSSSTNISMLESVQQSARILANLVERLFPNCSSHGTFDELQLILRKCFRPLNQTMVTLLGDPTHQRTLHALLLEFLDKFSAQHFDAYFRSLSNQLERLDTLSEMLHMFRDLLVRCPVPAEWCQLRRAHLRLFVKHLRLAAALCQRDFGTPAHFDAAIWCESILSCIMLAKCAGSTPNAGDDNGTKSNEDEDYDLMELDGQIETTAFKAADEENLRKYATEILRSLWFSLLPESKCQLMPHVTGPLLEMAFVGSDLCEFAVSIFVDMLATELRGGSADDVVVVRRRKKDYDELLEQPQQLFSDVFISRLDPLLDSSLSDALFAIFCKAFSRTFQRHCLEQIVAKQFEFSAFVQTVDRLLELFTAYRSVQHGTGDEMAEMGMFCTAQLVDFYQSIEQHELYVLYLYKLYTLHRTVGNWVEAGLTLKRHADLLRWNASNRPDSYLCGTARNNEGGEFGTELELKEYIYKEMAELFTRGEHWELAIETNRELANIYETTTFDYAKLADLLTRNAALYEKVTKTLRMESHYFMIAFYGKGCPSYLANHKFVARGRPLEQWGCFKQRLMANFSDFKFVDTVDNCEETYRELDGKFLQILPVSPMPFKEVYAKLLQNSPCRLASWYYKHHRVQRFELVRRAFRADTKWTQLEDNETTRLWLHKRIIQIQRPLPDLLSLGPVVSELELDPLNPAEVAIEKMREANDKLAETAAMVGEGFGQSLVNLAGMIRGVVQADVGGGIRNYQAFFSEESRAVCTEDERHAVGTLKQLILEQTALLEYALFIHSQSDRAQANAMFHNSLAGSFMEHRQRVEHWLGPVKSVLPEKTSIYVLEPSSDEASHHFEGSRQVAADQSPTPPTQKAPQKIARIASMHENGISNNIHQQQVRPTSMGSASGGSSSSSTNVFKTSNLGAALIKTTIQAKAKLKQKASRKGSAAVAIRANSIATPATTQQQLSAGHEFLSAISQARQSDTSMDTFLLEMEPPLPPRLSKAHSDQIVTNLRIRRQ